MSVKDWVFLETWIDPTGFPPYVLLLLIDEAQKCYVLDPKEDYGIVFSSDSYQETRYWLLEDEYERVNGRIAR